MAKNNKKQIVVEWDNLRKRVALWPAAVAAAEAYLLLSE